MPDVKDMTLNNAISTLQMLGFTVKSNNNGDANALLITDQTPKAGALLEKGSVVCLYTAENNEKIKVQVPNVKGKSISEARKILRENNLNIDIEGTSGVVVSQDPIYETTVDQGTIINVVIKEELKDAQ